MFWNLHVFVILCCVVYLSCKYSATCICSFSVRVNFYAALLQCNRLAGEGGGGRDLSEDKALLYPSGNWAPWGRPFFLCPSLLNGAQDPHGLCGTSSWFHLGTGSLLSKAFLPAAWIWPSYHRASLSRGIFFTWQRSGLMPVAAPCGSAPGGGSFLSFCSVLVQLVRSESLTPGWLYRMQTLHYRNFVS